MHTIFIVAGQLFMTSYPSVMWWRGVMFAGSLSRGGVDVVASVARLVVDLLYRTFCINVSLMGLIYIFRNVYHEINGKER